MEPNNKKLLELQRKALREQRKLQESHGKEVTKKMIWLTELIWKTVHRYHWKNPSNASYRLQEQSLLSAKKILERHLLLWVGLATRQLKTVKTNCNNLKLKIQCLFHAVKRMGESESYFLFPSSAVALDRRHRRVADALLWSGRFKCSTSGPKKIKCKCHRRC